jgi:hypothetical protein
MRTHTHLQHSTVQRSPATLAGQAVHSNIPATYNIYTTRRLKATSWVLRSLKSRAAHENARHIANKNTWTPQQLVTMKLGVVTSMHHTCAHAT